jgi:membrane protein DedA with SNARE-associated domain
VPSTLSAPFALATWIRSVLETGGYAALAGLTLLENLFPPIPSEVVLPLAGFYVGRGELTFLLALAAATAGSVAGALVLYAAGRFGGRFGLERRRGGPGMQRAQGWFDRHGGKVVLLGRLVPGVRSLVSVPAGAARMPLPAFVLLTTAGSLVWNAALIGAGWALGSQWERVGDVVGPAGRVVVVVLVAAAVVAALVAWRRRRAGAAV